MSWIFLVLGFFQNDNNYETIKVTAAEQKLKFAQSSDQKRVEMARKFIISSLIRDVLPEWKGTAWSFNGTTRQPGKGSIACGTFVVYVLQDMGFEIPSKMSQQPSENIIKNLVGTTPIKRFSNASMATFTDWVKASGPGIYLVGLDCHVGFVIYDKGQMHFCHSNYYEPAEVAIQPILDRSPLTDSKYRVIAKLFDDPMIHKWLEGQTLPVKHDYFETRN